MTARPEDPSAWPADPEPSSASGGHIAPGSAGGPLFDPLTAPLPSERARAEGTYDLETRPVERLDGRVPQPPPEEHRPSRRRRVASRRVRRTIKKVDPLSILKIAVVFYLVMLVVWLIVVAIVYNMIDATGLFTAMEEAARGALAVDNFDISLGTIEKYAFLIGVGSFVVASVGTLVGAILYNIAADLLGGVELTFVEREH